VRRAKNEKNGLARSHRVYNRRSPDAKKGILTSWRAVRMVQNPLGGAPARRDVLQRTVFRLDPDQVPRGNSFVLAERERPGD